MSSRNNVDPELLELLDGYEALGLNANPVSKETLDYYRSALAGAYESAPPTDKTDLAVEEVYVQSSNDGYEIRALLYRPVHLDKRIPALLYVHGGGYVLGAPEYHEERCCRIARELGITVFAPAYRLAPENPFPSGLDDCYQCLQEMENRADDFGIDPERIAIFGDSAGGGLAASVVQRTVAEYGPAIVFQALHYPMLDHRTGKEEGLIDDRCGEFVWTRESNRYAWSAYLGDNSPEDTSYAIPALQADLSDLPPSFITAASLDLFLDEDIAYTRRLLASGIKTEFIIYPGTFHLFEQASGATISQKFEQDLLFALRRGLSL